MHSNLHLAIPVQSRMHLQREKCLRLMLSMVMKANLSLEASLAMPVSPLLGRFLRHRWSQLKITFQRYTGRLPAHCMQP